MIDIIMLKIIDSIFHAFISVQYFCLAVKDCIGVVSVLLLLGVGIHHEVIIDDYV